MSIVGDYWVKKTPSRPVVRPLERPVVPPQVLKVGDLWADKVKVVFEVNGIQVPWIVISINCSEKYLVRWRTELPVLDKEVRHGNFRVEWEDGGE